MRLPGKITALLLAGLLVGLLVRPCLAWYDRYLEEDHAQTCERARVYLWLQYREALPENPSEEDIFTALRGSTGGPLPAETRIERAGEEYLCTGPCLSGGAYHIEVDAADPERLRITCSMHGTWSE